MGQGVQSPGGQEGWSPSCWSCMTPRTQSLKQNTQVHSASPALFVESRQACVCGLLTVVSNTQPSRKKKRTGRNAPRWGQ